MERTEESGSIELVVDAEDRVCNCRYPVDRRLAVKTIGDRSSSRLINDSKNVQPSSPFVSVNYLQVYNH